jgi:hypothetical protein
MAFSRENYTGVDFEKLADYSVRTVLQPTIHGFKSYPSAQSLNTGKIGLLWQKCRHICHYICPDKESCELTEFFKITRFLILCK